MSSAPPPRPLLRPEGLKVTFRKMRFPFEDTGFDRHWHGGSPFISHFWSSLSQAFGPGEKFFIDSVRALRDEVHDPALLEEMEQFVRQEAHHTLQHRKWNRMVGAMGYDVDALEGRYARALALPRRRLDARGMLTVTMALEHFTSCFAHQYFENPRLAAGADPNVVALWSWHAAEETEHKATAFDVYRQLGGGYLRRVVTIAPAWALIFVITMWNTFTMLAHDGPIDWRDVGRGLAYLFGRRGLVTGLVPAFFDYFRPGFHPWQEDDSAAITGWERANARYIELREDESPSPRRSSPPPLAVPTSSAA